MKKTLSIAGVLLLGVLLTRKAAADLTVQLKYVNNSQKFEVYEDYYPFRIQYANVPIINFTGLLHQPYPSDACDYITPLPDRALESGYPWFAVVSNYSLCTEEMIKNVRNAGYELLVAYSYDDASLSVDSFIMNSGFGVVIIPYDYLTKIQDYVVSDVNDTLPEPEVVLMINGEVVFTPALVTIIFLMALFLCGCSLCCCYVYCRGQRNQSLVGQMADIEARRRNFERVQRQERVARQELIESILRQLQELQVDMRLQEPLGREATGKLPTRKYRAGEEKIERCAICVEDFKDGDRLRVLPCEHSFHKECIDEWLINHSALCPLCKFEVPRGNASQPPPARERRPYFAEDSLTSSLDEDIPIVLVPRTSQQNSNRSTIRQYGSV